ncbi:MAG: class I SAM-dependent RNA methyltransferase [Methylovirgula sp.]
MRVELTIERLGQRGEGIARGADGLIYVPYALPGDTILAEVEGTRGRLVEITAPSRERIAPFCPHFGTCGGCAVQALAPRAYAEWKRDLLVSALRHAGIEAEVDPLVDAHGLGRRRATFHARSDGGKPRVGFMRARAHELIDLDSCPILAPQMNGALAAAHAVAATLRAGRKPLDIAVTAFQSGLDIDVKGHGPLTPAELKAAAKLAEAHDLARISNDRLVLVERRTPILRMGKADVAPPPGAFLQATEAGEAALAAKVCESLKGARQIADLFAGIGTFGLRLAERAQVHAVDSDESALAALRKAARSASGLRPITIEKRDLFRRPLGKEEITRFDAVLFDPPRAGAEAQAGALAQSTVPLIVAVSCSPQSFARDTALLVAGGYRLQSVTPFDQFRHSPHLECVGIFRRHSMPTRKPRKPLLG